MLPQQLPQQLPLQLRPLSDPTFCPASTLNGFQYSSNTMFLTNWESASEEPYRRVLTLALDSYWWIRASALRETRKRLTV